MDCHLLLPLSKHSKAGAGVAFVSHFFTEKEPVRLTLLHIPPSQAAVWAEEANFERLDALEMQAATADAKGRAVIDGARRRLVADGFDKENINDTILSAQASKGHDIIRVARKGKYDAVVLGHRAQIGLADLMDISVSREMLEGLAHAISFPLWICRFPERDRKNILLCVDGSEPSDRMADHVGFILSSEPGHDVTVFHVHNQTKTNLIQAEEVLNQAARMLMEAGLPEERITLTLQSGTNPAQLISEACDAGRYTAVAMGSAGSDRGLWDKLFVGSVARKVFKELHGATLWVCF
jgi:nucleotide-binding universal stress UspA family protein